MRKLGIVEFYLHIAPVSDTLGILDGFQCIWKNIPHFFFGFNVKLTAFITQPVLIGGLFAHGYLYLYDMPCRMAAADLVISRAGAMTLSEIALLRKAAIFIPSPNVAEDHQTKNAMALVNKDAAALLTDAEAEAKFFDVVSALVADDDKKKAFSDNISKLAVKNSADLIAKEIVQMVK